MVTNAGTKRMYQKGKIEGFGEAWFDPQQVANIFGFAKLEDRYRITYDSNIEKAFNVHTEDGIVKLKRNNDGLYTYRPSDEYLKDVAADNSVDHEYESTFMVQTTEENKKGYTQRQFERAKQARKLYHILGCPTVENYKHILRQNLIKNCPVTIEDVTIAEKIFGPDIGSLKGKSTRSRPQPVKEDLIEIPRELTEQHQDLTLCLDIMFVSGMPMLTGIDRSIRFRSLIALDSRSESSICQGIDSIVRLYHNAGFGIKYINCDQEFRPMMETIANEHNITMNYATAGEHVPEAERNNRTIQERIRATYHNLPYAIIPKTMIRYLAMVSTDQLNFFPAKGGISPYFSPHVILTGRALEFNKHCQYPFGAYVQANNDASPTNTNAPRTIDCIYLRPFPNLQGGHELMDLRSGRVITRRRITEIPVTDLVIQAVENMAIEQGIHTLKITGRHTTPIYPADWIAGVEYNQDNQNNQNNRDEDYIDDEEQYIEQEIDDEELYDRVDPTEIEDLIATGRDDEDAQGDNDEIQGEINEPDPIQQEEQVPDEQQVIIPDPVQQQLQDEVDVIEADEEEPDEEEEKEEHDESDPAPEIIDEDDTKEDPAEEQPRITRSGRVVVKPSRYIEQEHLILHQRDKNSECYIEYDHDIAIVAARTIESINYQVSQKGAGFSQQYILQKGLKKFGDKGRKAAVEELDQLHKRNCFEPVDVSQMTKSEKRKAMDSLLFLTEKRDGRVKGR